MISIDPKYLTHAARFVALRKPPDQHEGEQSLSKHTFLAWSGDGNFSVRCSDNCFFFLNQFPASGNDPAWSTPLISENARWLFTRLGTAAGFTQATPEAERRIRLDRAADGALCVQGNSFEGKFPSRRYVNPFPALTLPGPGNAWSRTNLMRLTEALEYLSQGCGRDDPFDRSQECGLFPDGKALGFDGMIALATTGPRLPFELTLRRRHAVRLAAWLKILKKVKQSLEVVEVAQFQNQGYYYAIRDTEGSHTLCIPKSTGTPARQVFDMAWNSPVTFRAKTDARTLAALSEVTACRGRERRLTCSFQADETGTRWHLHLQTEGATDDLAIQDRRPLTMISSPPDGSHIVFKVNAYKLCKAIGRVGVREVELVYREASRFLSILPYMSHGDFPAGHQQDECLLQVKRPEAAAAAPIELSQPG